MKSQHPHCPAKKLLTILEQPQLKYFGVYPIQLALHLELPLMHLSKEMGHAFQDDLG